MNLITGQFFPPPLLNIFISSFNSEKEREKYIYTKMELTINRKIFFRTDWTRSHYLAARFAQA